MSKIEVNQISKTPTGNEVTVISDLYLEAPIKFASYTTAQISAIQNPVDGQLVYDTDEGTVKVYKGSTSDWVQVGGTEHTQAFNRISVQGQLDVVTTTQNDYLVFVAGDDITITTNPANKTIEFDVAPLDTSAVSQHIIPATNNLYDLGSSTFKWNEAYVQDTIHMGNSSIQAINVGVNDDKISFSDKIELDGIVDNSGGSGIDVIGDMNIDLIRTDELREKSTNANITLSNDLVLASGVTIDFTSGSATGLGGSGGGTNANLLMNGSFDIWQRSTVGSQNNTGTPNSADRWLQTGSVSQLDRATFSAGQSDVPSSPKYYGRWFSSQTGTCTLEQRIEGVQTGQGGQVTYSFWARTASGTRNVSVVLSQVFGITGSFTPTVNHSGSTHTLDATWTQYSGTVTLSSTSGTTIGSLRDQATHDHLAFKLQHSGSSFDIYLANIKLEIGGSVTSFERLPYNTELYNCARYFQKVGEGQEAIIGWGGGSRNNVMDGILPYKLGPLYRFPDKIHSGQYRFVRGIYSEYGNYLNHNFYSHVDDIGWGCWNVDIGNNIVSYFITIAGGNSSMRWMWNAEIGS